MTAPTTLAHAIDRYGVDVLDHLDREATIPTVTRIGRQGDVLILARTGARVKPAATPLPADGFPAVRGEAGGNTHLLLADGAVFYDPQAPSPSDLTLGRLTVAEGSTAYLAHPEHAYLAIAPRHLRVAASA